MCPYYDLSFQVSQANKENEMEEMVQCILGLNEA
jgi:hypothetical protein